MLVQQVTSVSIRALGYDETGERLWVEYHSHPGGYLYRGVSFEIFDWLLQAESIGGFVNRVIKPNFPHEYRRVPPG
ncbi:MAG: KTSC domain-containing protein [Alphaproteobacteria bacterium]|nr:KTSC domain-containing protein [Alphaproteobacteria bacterium]